MRNSFWAKEAFSTIMQLPWLQFIIVATADADPTDFILTAREQRTVIVDGTARLFYTDAINGGRRKNARNPDGQMAGRGAGFSGNEARNGGICRRHRFYLRNFKEKMRHEILIWSRTKRFCTGCMCFLSWFYFAFPFSNIGTSVFTVL